MLRRSSTLVGTLALTLALFGGRASLVAREPAAAAPADPADIEFFEKQVRPILVARCYECHAGKEQKGGLRLDSRAALLSGGDTGPAVVPNKPDESLLVDAVRYGDLYQMPPSSQLPADEVTVLEQWVERGVPWGVEASPVAAPKASGFDLAARAEHWSWQPLKKVEPPQVASSGWIRTPIDRFLLAKLEAAELPPAKAADRRTLIRRVTFDLTGLPPTPEEIAAFTGDTAPNAYEKLVNRLLDSPRYGERWARHWLDLVRFAETHGHEFDFDIPGAYRYRDYVIRALNDDLPFDQFVVEHVAGDLLPRPRRNADGTNESILATGWYFFGEAVHSPVDVRADEATRIDNQIDVFSKTFLGLTVSCARCHDHKFDAISTKDYYALAGYLQSSRYQQAYLDPPDFLQAELAELRAVRSERVQAQRDFVRAAIQPRSGETTAALSETSPSPENQAPAGNPAPANLQPLDFDGAGFAAWTATGLAFAEGIAGPLDWDFAAEPSTGRLITRPTAHSGLLSAKLQGVLRSPTFEITGPTLWYRAYGQGGRIRLVLDGLQLIRAPIYGGLEFGVGHQQPTWQPQDLSKWIGHHAYIELVDDGDGFIALDGLAFADSQPRDAGNGMATATAGLQETLSRWLDDPGFSPAPETAEQLGKFLSRARSDSERTPAARAALDHAMTRLAARQQAVEARIVPPQTAPAILDGTAENERVFIRGNHKTLGDEVPRRFLEALGGSEHAPPSQGSGRLELARQLVSPACPLVPRVIVNRLWHHHFGAGLVRSPDDFGVMGQEPTHPELLDYLAGELVSNGWSLKHIHRLMVLSATYRMSSQAEAVADELDPQNKLWHRMQVRRLEAESIRDAMLFVSGRLKDQPFGPGVMPHLTEFMVGRGRPNESGPLDGDGRRSIYLTVRRNFLPPLFQAFDYPTPFTTIGRRGTSNVPAQALAMMNNPLVIEQAGHWADRALAQPNATSADRIRAMYEAAFARLPDDGELDAGLAFVEAGDRQTWADFAHVLLNVKEFIYIP